MRLMLLGCAAAALMITGPALARDSGNSSGGWHNGGGHDGNHHGRRHSGPFGIYASADDQRHNGRGDGFVGGGYGYGYGMEDRTFEPDSYNDWWHDRPARAYPRWVQDNANCAPERMWWHGDTLRC